MNYYCHNIPFMPRYLSTRACEKVASDLGLCSGFWLVFRFPSPLSNTWLVATWLQYGRKSVKTEIPNWSRLNWPVSYDPVILLKITFKWIRWMFHCLLFGCFQPFSQDMIFWWNIPFCFVGPSRCCVMSCLLSEWVRLFQPWQAKRCSLLVCIFLLSWKTTPLGPLEQLFMAFAQEVWIANSYALHVDCGYSALLCPSIAR